MGRNPEISVQHISLSAIGLVKRHYRAAQPRPSLSEGVITLCSLDVLRGFADLRAR